MTNTDSGRRLCFSSKILFLAISLISLILLVNLLSTLISLSIDRYFFYGLYGTIFDKLFKGVLTFKLVQQKWFFVSSFLILILVFCLLNYAYVRTGIRTSKLLITFSSLLALLILSTIFFPVPIVSESPLLVVYLLPGIALSLFLPLLSARKRLFSFLRNSSFVVLGLFALFVGFSYSYQFFHKQRNGNKTNIFIILLDTLRDDVLTSYGAPEDRSPNLSRFAGDSVVFSNTLSQHPSTAPSIKSMLTSLYPECITGDSYHLSEFKSIRREYLLLPEILSNRGYINLAFTDGGGTNPILGFNQGFDFYQSIYEKDKDIKTKLDRFKTYFREHDELKENPFFVFLHTYQIHSEYIKGEPYKSKYYDELEITDKDKAEWKVFKDYYAPIYYKAVRNTDPNLKYKALNIITGYNSAKMLRANYEGGVSYTDDQLGNFFNWLKKEGLYEDSLIMVTSDHGEMFLEHMNYWGHGKFLFDELLRVPLMVKFPKQQYKGTVVDDLVGLIDIVPTICDFLGIDTKNYIHQGKSLLKIMNSGQNKRRFLFSQEITFEMASVGDGKMKYIFPQGEEFMQKVRGAIKSKMFDDYFSGGEYHRGDGTERPLTDGSAINNDLWYGLFKQWEKECATIKTRIIGESLFSGGVKTKKSSGKEENDYIDELRKLGYAY